MTRRTTLIATLFGLIGIPGIAASQTTASSGDWQRVDTLTPGTRIVVRLKTGEERIAAFRRATADELTIAPSGAGSERLQASETLAKVDIARVSTRDAIVHGVWHGAWVGGLAMVVLVNAALKGCGTGCEADAPYAAALVPAMVGAGIGSLVGFLADRDAGPSELLFSSGGLPSGQRAARTNRFFPGRPTVRVGPVFSQMAFPSSGLGGSASVDGFALAVQVSPHISAHAEYARSRSRLRSVPGSVPDAVLQNVVPATSRSASRSHGIESRRVSFVFSELLGVEPRPWGRVRLEFVGGFTIHGREDRDYYEAYRDSGAGTMSDPGRTERIPGKYYVLEFQSPTIGLVTGMDAEIALVRGLSVVPMLRYNLTTGDPGRSIVYGMGAQWRF